MCTIGVVFDSSNVHTFKQCDLIPETQFNEPEVRQGNNGVKAYTAMTRRGSDGIWAGVNDTGVSFVAADSYTTTAADYYTTSEQLEALFVAYEKSISNYTNAREAAIYLTNFYNKWDGRASFPAPDISLITGWKDNEKTQPVAYFIEYMPNPNNHESVRVVERTDGYFASTNNFRLQPDSVNYPANHSTYLRLKRAEVILQSDPTKEGIKTLLTDQYYGSNELSICRETKYRGQEFRTQATALFSVSSDLKIGCDYQINGNPRDNPLRLFEAQPTADDTPAEAPPTTTTVPAETQPTTDDTPAEAQSSTTTTVPAETQPTMSFNEKIKIDRNKNELIDPPASDFFYVDQGNYLTLPLASHPFTMYSDGATSCIIVIVVATKEGKSTVTLAHLDSPECIKAFFKVITDRGADRYYVYAQGANPRNNKTSTSNARQFVDSVHAPIIRDFLYGAEVFFEEGDPRRDNRGNFGFSYQDDGSIRITNQPFNLELYQRDPTCGGQTVYCILRRQENPPVQLRDAGKPFTHPELVELSSIALQFQKDENNPSTKFTNIMNLQNEEVRKTWSTTPEYEAPWFSDQLKLGAAFAIAMAPVVSLSEQHLSKTTTSTFTRMRSSLLD